MDELQSCALEADDDGDDDGDGDDDDDAAKALWMWSDSSAFRIIALARSFPLLLLVLLPWSDGKKPPLPLLKGCGDCGAERLGFAASP
jgi:hypothetical protein